MKDSKIIDKVTDLDFNYPSKELVNPTIRYASRGVVFNESGLVAVIHKVLKNEYKLPGGGIENENPREAFLREVLEETGCLVEITDYLGIIIEEKSLTNFKQISHVYIARVLKDTKKLHLTHKELDEGTTIIWESFERAYELIQKSQDELKGSVYDTRYQSLFMVKRDEKIMDYVKRLGKTR